VVIAADIWAAVGGVGSVVAAVAAAVAVWFAKSTVDEARRARTAQQEAHEELLASHQRQLDAAAGAHRDEMTERARALAAEQSAHEELLAGDRQQLEASTRAHEAEMTQRAQAAAAERDVAVIRQLQHLSGVLLALADCARDEAVTPPTLISEVSPFPLTRIPGILAGMRSGVAMVRALGGPELPETHRIAQQGHTVGSAPMRFVGEAFAGLQEVEGAIARRAAAAPDAPPAAAG
jgi:hypothetical protein